MTQPHLDALEGNPALRQRMEEFIAREKPDLERLLALEVRRGTHPSTLAGVLSDGGGPVSKMTQIVPLELAQRIVGPLRAMGWGYIAERFEKPNADELMMLVFFEGQPGFASLGVCSVTHQGAQA